MIWLSTSRIMASDLDTYTELDGIMSGVGTVFGLLGSSVLAQRRYIDGQIRHALAEGHDHYRDGEYVKAIEDYDKAQKISPKSKIARTCKADALCQMKKYDEAVRLYDNVIMDDKDYAPAISGKGSALRQKGELAKSVIYLQKALNLDPSSKVAWNNKGNAFFFLDQLRTAIFCYKKAIELDPEYSGAWYNMAVAYTNSGNFLEADHAFRTATNLFERRRKRPLLEKTKAGAPKDFLETLQDITGDISLEMLMGDLEKKVISHISFNPGATRKEIALGLNLGDIEVKAVVAALTKSHVISSKRDGAKIRYYPKEQLPVMIHVMEVDSGSVAERKVRYLTDLQRRMVDEVEANPGISAKDISTNLGISRQVVQFQLRTLTDGGVLNERKEGLKKGFFTK
jgi:tetratricopeptide (TPR) repeat protein